MRKLLTLSLATLLTSCGDSRSSEARLANSFYHDIHCTPSRRQIQEPIDHSLTITLPTPTPSLLSTDLYLPVNLPLAESFTPYTAPSLQVTRDINCTPSRQQIPYFPLRSGFALIF